MIEIGWRSLFLLSLSIPTLFAAVFVCFRSADRPANYWLSALLFVWCWHTIPYIIGFAGAYDVWPWLTFFPFNMEFWIGPLVYFYTCALIKDKLPSKFWLLPGILQFTYYTICFVALGSAADKYAFNAAVHLPYVIPVERVLGLILALGGLWLSYKSARQYTQRLKLTHSSAEKYNLLWLRRFIAAVGICILGWFLVDLIDVLFGPLRYVENYWIYIIIGGVMVWLAFEALARSAFLFPEAPIVARSAPPSTEPKLDINIIRQTIVEREWFRDEGLTVNKLARHLATNQNYLSTALNSADGSNFNLFINTIRVEDVIAQINDDPARNLLNIALDAGFASKATFNRAFKTVTGETPSGWRKAKRLKS